VDDACGLSRRRWRSPLTRMFSEDDVHLVVEHLPVAQRTVAIRLSQSSK